MSVEVRLEPLDGSGEWTAGSVEDVEVVRRLVAEGAPVAAGDELIEVVLDKANVVLPAAAAGVVRWHVQEGDLLQPGALLATIEEA